MQLEQVMYDGEEEAEAEGSRRSKRKKFRPLDYWRNERVVYGRRESGMHVMPCVCGADSMCV